MAAQSPKQSSSRSSYRLPYPRRETPPNQSLGRIAFLDVARSLAITMALLHHAMVDLGGWLLVGSSGRALLLSVMRAATPSFIFLFGMMLEVVYQRRAERSGMEGVTRRLVKRSAQCYAGYLATVVAGILGGMLSPREGLLASVFLTDAYFGNILKFYTIALLVAPPLLMVRQRTGLPGALMLGLGLWLFTPLLEGIAWPDQTHHLVSFLFGVGSETGPSVMNGLTFVVLGMATGGALRRLPWAGTVPYYRALASIVGACGLVLAYLLTQSSLPDVIHNYVDATVYRASNHPGYYALGSLSAVVMVGGLSMLMPHPFRVPSWLDILLVFGRSSLLAFTLGNVILNLRPHMWKPHTIPLALALSLVVVLAVMGLLHARSYLASVTKDWRLPFIP